MPNYIFQDLKTHAPNCKLETRLLQGSTNRTFAFTLFDRGKQSLLNPATKIDIIVLYNPRFVNGQLLTDSSFVMNSTDSGYDVTIREAQIDNKFSIIYVPLRDEYVTYADGATGKKVDVDVDFVDENNLTLEASVNVTVDGAISI